MNGQAAPIKRWRLSKEEFRCSHHKIKVNEIPNTAISGCMQTASTLQNIHHRFCCFSALQVANRIVKMTIDREVRYWSSIQSAVPATGIVNTAATIVTAAHLAQDSRNNSTLKRQHASSVRKIQPRYQMNTAISNERCERRILPAIVWAKSVKRA